MSLPEASHRRSPIPKQLSLGSHSSTSSNAQLDSTLGRSVSVEVETGLFTLEQRCVSLGSWRALSGTIGSWLRCADRLSFDLFEAAMELKHLVFEERNASVFGFEAFFDAEFVGEVAVL